MASRIACTSAESDVAEPASAKPRPPRPGACTFAGSPGGAAARGGGANPGPAAPASSGSSHGGGRGGGGR
eukprot:11183146-Lingulodinium_polyedra.AAC.1